MKRLMNIVAAIILIANIAYNTRADTPYVTPTVPGYDGWGYPWYDQATGYHFQTNSGCLIESPSVTCGHTDQNMYVGYHADGHPSYIVVGSNTGATYSPQVAWVSGSAQGHRGACYNLDVHCHWTLAGICYGVIQDYGEIKVYCCHYMTVGKDGQRSTFIDYSSDDCP